MYEPPKPQIAPPNISPSGACTWKIVLRDKVEQRKNGKFTSILKRNFPTVDKPLKKSL